MAAVEVELEAGGKGEGLQAVFVDGFAPEGTRAAVGVVGVGSVLVVLDVARGFEVGGHDVGRQRLVAAEVLVIVEVQGGGECARGSTLVEGLAVHFHDAFVA